MKKKYDPRLSINENDIDREILQQAQLYFEWSYAAAEAENVRDNEKEVLEIILGKIESKIRNNLEEYFKTDKATESAIKHKANNDVAVLKQRSIYNNARANAKLLKAAERAYEQRKSMIEAFIKRENQRFNSEVKIPKIDKDKISKKLRSRLNKN